MVFHMIRRKVGEEAFWNALRDVYRNRLFKKASWSDLRQAFEARGQQSLKDFLDQWLARPNAPRLSLENVELHRVDDKWKVSGQIIQTDPPYRVPIRLALTAGSERLIRQIDYT